MASSDAFFELGVLLGGPRPGGIDETVAHVLVEQSKHRLEGFRGCGHLGEDIDAVRVVGDLRCSPLI